MSICSIKNKSGEPKPFYQTELGTFNNLRDALIASRDGDTITIGFINSSDTVNANTVQEFDSLDHEVVVYGNEVKISDPKAFIKSAETTVSFDKGTPQGFIFSGIRDGLLKETSQRTPEGHFIVHSFGNTEVLQKVNSQDVLNELKAHSEKHGYEKRGTVFIIKDTYGKKKFGNKYYTEEELQNSETTDPDLIYLQERYKQHGQANKNNTEYIHTNDTNESLESSIIGFLQDIGVSLVSIEEYRRKYAQKHGVHPDAKALADIANSIIALREGEATIEDLTEEAVHFIVEGWTNQEEIQRLLNNVQYTQEWIEFADVYREVYSEQYDNPEQLEDMVRREVLGKFITNQLKRSPETRTETEENIFNYALRILREYLNRLFGNTTDSKVQELKDFSNRVDVLLHNKELSNFVIADNLRGSQMLPMYAISESSPFYRLHKNSLKALQAIQNNLVVLQKLSNIPGDLAQKLETVGKSVEEIDSLQEEEQIYNTRMSVIGLFGIFDTKVRELEILMNGLKEGQPIPDQYQQVHFILKNELLPFLQAVQNSAYRNKETIKDQDGSLQKIMDEAFSRYNRVSGAIEGNHRESVREEILEAVERRGGEEARLTAQQLIDKEHSDSNWFFKMFGQIKDSKIPYVAKLGQLVFDMTSTVRKNFLETSIPYAKKLQSRAKRLPFLARKGYLFSHINHAERQRKISEARAKALKEVLLLDESVEELAKTMWSERTIEEYISAQKLNVEPRDVYLSFVEKADRYVLDSGVIDKNSDAYIRKKRFFETLDRLNISKETYFFIKNQSSQTASLRAKMGGELADPTNPINVSYLNDLNTLKATRSQYKDVFEDSTATNKLYSLKEGLYSITEEEYNPFDPDHVKINNNLWIRIDRSQASDSALTAFELNRFDRDFIQRKEQAQVLEAQGLSTESTGWSLVDGVWEDSYSMFTKGSIENIKEDLRKAWQAIYDEEISSGSSINTSIENANRRTFEYFSQIGRISFRDEFYDLEDSTSLVDLLEENGGVQPTIISNEIRILRGRRSLILKKYQESYDYREIDGTAVSLADRASLDEIQKRISELTLIGMELLGIEDLNEVTSSRSDIERRPNQSFYRLFQDTYGEDYTTTSDMNIKLEFLNSIVSPETIDASKRLERALINFVNNGVELPDAWYNVLDNLGYTIPDSVLEAQEIVTSYLESRIPSYFIRFAPIEYGEIMNQMRTNMISLLNQKGGIIDSIVQGGHPLLEFTVTQTTQEERGVKYAQTLDAYQKQMELAEQETNEAQKLLKKYEAYLHLVGQDEGVLDSSLIDQEFLSHFGMTLDNQGKLTAPIKNLEDFDSLVTLLEMRFISLENHNELLKTNIFKTARLPAKTLQRFSSADLMNFLKYEFEDNTRYREDEEEAYFRTEARQIPKVGFSQRIPDADLSTDMFMVALTDLYNSEMYLQRSQTLSRARAIQDLVEQEVKIKGKNLKKSEVWEMVESYMDSSFYGRQTTWKGSITLPGGIQMDVSKLLVVFRNFVQTASLGFSVPVAITSLTTAGTNKFIQRFVKYHMYAPASNRANVEWAKLIGGSAMDMGKTYTESKLELLMQYFGNYDLTTRSVNAAYGYGARNMADIQQLAFSVHQMANAPLIPRVMLSKLMEYRFVDGRFVSWSNFLTIERAKDPSKKNSEIQEEFEKYKNLNLYDFIDINPDTGGIWKQSIYDLDFTDADGNLLSEKEKEQEIQKMYLDIRRDIMYNVSQYDGIIDSSQKTIAQKHPIFAFATVFRSWLTIASTRNFSPQKINFDTGNIEEGIANSVVRTTANVLTRVLKEKQNPMTAAREEFANLSPAEIANLKTFGITLGVITAFTIMTAALIDWSDDDEDNYALAFTSYLASRLLNETFNSSIGLPSEYYSFIENPVSAVSTIHSVSRVLDFTNIGSEVERGAYKGWDRYTANLFRMTFFKNFYGLSSTDALLETRKGYAFFNSQTLFSPFSIIKMMNEAKEEPVFEEN